MAITFVVICAVFRFTVHWSRNICVIVSASSRAWRATLEAGCRYSQLARMEAHDFNPDANTIAIGKSKMGIFVKTLPLPRRRLGTCSVIVRLTLPEPRS